MKRLLTIIIFLPLLVACPSMEDLPDFTGSVSGVVMCQDQPVEGVEVTITPGGSSLVTKSNGTYTFENLTTGSYTLTFKKKGYKTATKNVNIAAGAVASGDVNLLIDGNLVSFDLEILNFGKEVNNMTFNIINQLDRLVSWEIRQDNLPDWVSFKSFSGDVPSNSQNVISVTVDRSKVKGEKDSFSLDIDLSTGNTLSIKVNIEAGPVGKVVPELHDVGYDYAIIKFNMGENCTGFYAGVDNTNTRPPADIRQYGVYYEDDENSIKFYCDQYPGQMHFLYIIPVNQYGQEGEMEVFELPLKSTPEIKYTALKDIKTPGTYNVKDAFVLYADGWRCVLTDDKGYSLFYVYFDSSYPSAPPKTGQILELSGEVKLYNNILEFTNPEYSVTGSANLEDVLEDAAADVWESSMIANGRDMLSYCSLSSPGIRQVSLRGRLSSSVDGEYYYIEVSESSGIMGSVLLSDKSILKSYDSQLVDIDGIAIGYYEYQGTVYLQIMVVDIEKVDEKPTLESYLGYWNASAYNFSKDQWETWENMYFYSYENESTGDIETVLSGWMYGNNYSFFRSIGYYDDTTGDIILKGWWGGGSFTFANDETKYYTAYFYPVYVEGEEGFFIEPSRIEYPTAILRYTDSEYNKMEYVGDSKYPDENGRVANAFTFLYVNNDDEEDYGWFYTYTDITFTRSTNPPAEASYSIGHNRKPSNYVEVHSSIDFPDMEYRSVTDRLPRRM